MISKCCNCGKITGFKAPAEPSKWFSVSHGYCDNCLEGMLFKIPGYVFKWIKYAGWKQVYRLDNPVLDPLERILATILGVVLAVLMITVI